MRKPDQSLDDYIVRPAPEVASEPPRAVSLRRTGEVEVLKPLTRSEARARYYRYAFKAPYQPLWFRRFLAVGSGALVMIAFVLVSAILVGINDPPAGRDIATNLQPDDTLTRPDEPFTVDDSSPSTFEPATGGVDIVRTYARRRPARPRIHPANKPRRQLRPLLQPEHPKFVPTTLVIYAENGVINTRIEPWIQSGDEKPRTFSN